MLSNPDPQGYVITVRYGRGNWTGLEGGKEGQGRRVKSVVGYIRILIRHDIRCTEIQDMIHRSLAGRHKTFQCCGEFFVMPGA